MKSTCAEIEKRLGPWMDRELDQAEAAEVESHLSECRACSEQKEQWERLQGSLRTVLEARAANVSFEPFWREVSRRISERRPWHAALRDWAQVVFYRPRLNWAIPVVILLLLGALSMEQFFPGWGLGLATSNVAAVDSVDGHGLNVAVFRESRTKTTVIWLYQNQDEQNESSDEPASTDNPF